jgi:Mn2+/Fe2+ NRAMP family transporter
MSRTNALTASKRKPRNIIFRLLGPGLVTGAADDDPSGIATYSQAGAQFGLWIAVDGVSHYAVMIAIQLVSAHIGRVTGKGIAANAKEFYSLSLVLVPVCLLVVANTINIAADLAGMGEALYLVIGGLKHEHALIFAATSVLLQVCAVPAICPYFEISDARPVSICGGGLHNRNSLAGGVRWDGPTNCLTRP